MPPQVTAVNVHSEGEAEGHAGLWPDVDMRRVWDEQRVKVKIFSMNPDK